MDSKRKKLDAFFNGNKNAVDVNGELKLLVIGNPNLQYLQYGRYLVDDRIKGINSNTPLELITEKGYFYEPYQSYKKRKEEKGDICSSNVLSPIIEFIIFFNEKS